MNKFLKLFFLTSMFSCGFIFCHALATTTSSTTSTTSIPGGPVNVNVDSLEKNSSGIPIVNPEQVNNEDDLKVLQNNYKILNPNIDNIYTNTNTDGTMEIVVIYKHPGNFLGILPSSFKTTTTVSSSPNNIPSVESRNSFWSSLVADKKINKERIISRISNNQIIKNEMKINITPVSAARVMQAIIFELDQEELLFS